MYKFVFSTPCRHVSNDPSLKNSKQLNRHQVHWCRRPKVAAIRKFALKINIPIINPLILKCFKSRFQFISSVCVRRKTADMNFKYLYTQTLKMLIRCKNLKKLQYFGEGVFEWISNNLSDKRLLLSQSAIDQGIILNLKGISNIPSKITQILSQIIPLNTKSMRKFQISKNPRILKTFESIESVKTLIPSNMKLPSFWNSFSMMKRLKECNLIISSLEDYKKILTEMNFQDLMFLKISTVKDKPLTNDFADIRNIFERTIEKFVKIKRIHLNNLVQIKTNELRGPCPSQLLQEIIFTNDEASHLSYFYQEGILLRQEIYLIEEENPQLIIFEDGREYFDLKLKKIDSPKYTDQHFPDPVIKFRINSLRILKVSFSGVQDSFFSFFNSDITNTLEELYLKLSWTYLTPKDMDTDLEMLREWIKLRVWEIDGLNFIRKYFIEYIISNLPANFKKFKFTAPIWVRDERDVIHFEHENVELINRPKKYY